MADQTKLTVNLTPRSVQALTIGATLTEMNRTNTVNQALQVFAYIQRELVAGNKIMILTADNKLKELVITPR